MRTKITILGASGSIGTQTLDVIRQSGDKFEINYLSINRNINILKQQCEEFKPKGVIITDLDAAQKFRTISDFSGKILVGPDALTKVAREDDYDVMLSSLVGFAGVLPTLEAAKRGKTIALANKETLVSAGSIITKTAKEFGAKLMAVDSEHNAILQCLVGENSNHIEKIILTASGGPFRNTPKSKFAELSIADALNHPNWAMGSKITIDSATMMNKGFEVIEAFWLFDITLEQIDVLVHPESIVHSLVQFKDGSLKAQLGLPDMRIPISHALFYPERLHSDFPRLDLSKIATLNFSKPEYDKFRCLEIAFESINAGGHAPTIVNAANEIAVDAFLTGKISFDKIPHLIDEALNKIDSRLNGEIGLVVETDTKTREFVKKLV